MNPSTEMQALQWLERALERPAPDRLAWLHAQSMPDGLRRRVVRLLESESSLGDFLEHPPAMPVPDGFPQPGERVGPFQLAARIDSGGMGVVHLAHRVDRAYEQQVAVKLIRPRHPGADPALLRSWLPVSKTSACCWPGSPTPTSPASSTAAAPPPAFRGWQWNTWKGACR